MNTQKPISVGFRVSEEEYEIIQEKIKESGLNKQAFFHHCVMEKPIVKREYNPVQMNAILDELERLNYNIKIYGTEFRNQGINLNQIAKKMNETGQGTIDVNATIQRMAKAVRECEEIWQSSKQLLQMLQSEERLSMFVEKTKQKENVSEQ